MHKRLSPATMGFLFALGSAALFAIRPVFVKLIYAEGVDSTTLLAFRMLFSAPIYIALLLYFLRKAEFRARLSLALILKIAAVGMLGYYAASFLDLLGLQYLTAQLARMILYIYPTFVVLFGVVLFGGRITARVIASLLITYSGIAVIFGHDLNEFGSDVIIGGLFITGSAITFALYLLLCRPLIEQVGSRLFTSIALIAASIGILVHFSIARSFSGNEMTNRALVLIMIIAVFCTVIPTFLTTAAVARIGSDRTGIVATVGPAFTSLAAVLVLSESFTGYHLLGIALTVFGVWVLQRK